MRRFWLVFLVPAILCAQPPRGGRGLAINPTVAKQLNLTDDQTRQLNQIDQEFRPRLFTVRDQVNKAESAVEAVFSEDPVDEAKGTDAINKLATARAELTRAVSQRELKMRMVLTPQQWQQLKESQREPWPGRGPRRRGPPTQTPNQK